MIALCAAAAPLCGWINDLVLSNRFAVLSLLARTSAIGGHFDGYTFLHFQSLNKHVFILFFAHAHPLFFIHIPSFSYSTLLESVVTQIHGEIAQTGSSLPSPITAYYPLLVIFARGLHPFFFGRLALNCAKYIPGSLLVLVCIYFMKLTAVVVVWRPRNTQE